MKTLPLVLLAILVSIRSSDVVSKTQNGDSSARSAPAKVKQRPSDAPKGVAKTKKLKETLAAKLDKLAGGKPPHPKVVEKRVGTKTRLGVLTNRVYDYRRVIKTLPKLKPGSKATGGTVLTSAAYSITSRVSKVQFDQLIRIMKIDLLKGNPRYRDVVKQMVRSNLKLAQLPPYQVYAYDEQTGKLLVLEDTEMKKRLAR